MPRAKIPRTTIKPYVHPRSSPSPRDGDVPDGIPVHSCSGIKTGKNKNKNKNKSENRPSRGKTQPKRGIGEDAPIVPESDPDDDVVIAAVVKPSTSEQATQGTPSAKPCKTPWANDEYVLVFAHVAANVRLAGKAMFEGVVPGRIKTQTYHTWKTAIEPHIRTMLAWSGQTVETKEIKDLRAARETKPRGKVGKPAKKTKCKATSKGGDAKTDEHNVAPGSHRAMYVGDDDTVNEEIDELDSDSD